MGESPRIAAGDFAQYLQSLVQLNVLEKMTNDLDKELADSQNVMMEIKALYNSLNAEQNTLQEPVTTALRNEDISNFLDASTPNILMQGMSEDFNTVDIDNIIASMKAYVEDIKNNISIPDNQDLKPKEFVKLDVDLYVQNLSQLSNRLTNIKLNKKVELRHRNVELEDKLTQLCNDVNNFTTMMQAKTALYNSNKKLEQNESKTLQYNNIINKLLSNIHELSYLLQNKH